MGDMRFPFITIIFTRDDAALMRISEELASRLTAPVFTLQYITR